MQKNVTNRRLRVWLSCILLATLCVVARAGGDDDDKKWVVRGGTTSTMTSQRVEYNLNTLANDSLHNRSRIELSPARLQMMQSSYPVNIRQVGASLCVMSDYTQMLPIYTETRRFYASFRLNKGTNWLSGLPRGTYFINNRRITIL